MIITKNNFLILYFLISLTVKFMNYTIITNFAFAPGISEGNFYIVFIYFYFYFFFPFVTRNLLLLSKLKVIAVFHFFPLTFYRTKRQQTMKHLTVGERWLFPIPNQIVLQKRKTIFLFLYFQCENKNTTKLDWKSWKMLDNSKK